MRAAGGSWAAWEEDRHSSNIHAGHLPAWLELQTEVKTMVIFWGGGSLRVWWCAIFWPRCCNIYWAVISKLYTSLSVPYVLIKLLNIILSYTRWLSLPPFHLEETSHCLTYVSICLTFKVYFILITYSLYICFSFATTIYKLLMCFLIISVKFCFNFWLQYIVPVHFWDIQFFAMTLVFCINLLKILT